MSSQLENKSFNVYLKGKYFGLLKDREKRLEYEHLLDSIIVDLLSVPEDKRSLNWNILFSKTASLKYLNYKYFRLNVLDSMKLIDKVFKNELS